MTREAKPLETRNALVVPVDVLLEVIAAIVVGIKRRAAS